MRLMGIPLKPPCDGSPESEAMQRALERMPIFNSIVIGIGWIALAGLIVLLVIFNSPR